MNPTGVVDVSQASVAAVETATSASEDARRWVRADMLAPPRSDAWCGAVNLDLERRLAWVRGVPVALRPQETRLLRLLTAQARQVVEYQSLCRELYGPQVPEDLARVRLKSLVADVRRRLGPDLQEALRTAHRVGLVLYVELRR